MSLMRVCVVCIVKDASKGLNQLMGVWRKRMCSQATNQQEDSGRM